MIENKIARICWNTEVWRKPSGSGGKSKLKKTYERKFGYGHEEWLLDTTKLIDGWHFGFLQPIYKHRPKYVGKTFNISLYSIDEERKRRWWVGRIKNVIVTTPQESLKAYTEYQQRGWIKEMAEQLRSVGANVNDFRRKVDPQEFAVLRFRPESLDLLETPMEFSKNDRAVKTTYYVLLNQLRTPKLLLTGKQFKFSPGHTNKKGSSRSGYENQSRTVDLVHNQIQNNLYASLSKTFGRNNVGTEQESGHGSQIDLVQKCSGNQYIFYEIKTNYSVRLCIREALGQLLEYAYYPRSSNARKLVVVSPIVPTTEVKNYLRTIRSRFKIPIYYQRYDPAKKTLENALH